MLPRPMNPSFACSAVRRFIMSPFFRNGGSLRRLILMEEYALSESGRSHHDGNPAPLTLLKFDHCDGPFPCCFCRLAMRSASPSVLNTPGSASSTASGSWQVLQSCVMVIFLSDVECDPSWQRKHPGKSVCPRLLGYVPQVTLRSGNTFRL